MTVGQKIRETRKKNKILQVDLAKMCGISISSLRGYEGGHHQPRPETLQKIAAALGVDVKFLLDGNPETGWWDGTRESAEQAFDQLFTLGLNGEIIDGERERTAINCFRRLNDAAQEKAIMTMIELLDHEENVRQ